MIAKNGNNRCEPKESTLHSNDTVNWVVQPESKITWKFWKRKRYIVVLMVFLGMCNMSHLRNSISVGIVAMTADRNVSLGNGTIVNEPYFPWNSKEKGFILSGFFYGLILSNFASGVLGSKVGPALVYSLGLGMASFLTLLTPLAANAGIYYIFSLRFLIGLCEGSTFPCMYGIWSNWAPPLERSCIVSICYSGTNIGTVFCLPFSALMIDSFGWEITFYFFGFIGCAWYILWLFIVREYPASDKSISSDELRYIKESLKTTELEKINFPMKAALTSLPLWAIIGAHFVGSWGYYTILTQLPQFYSDTMDFNLKQSGILSALPYLVYGCVLPFTGYLVDFIISRNFLTITQIRKYSTCVSFLIQTFCLLTIAFLMNQTASVCLMILNLTISSFAVIGYGVNVLDIAPQFSSILSGIVETVATTSGIISPTLTGFIVQHKLVEEWRIVFYVNSGLYIAGIIIYFLLASGEVQPWAINKCDPSIEENKTKNDK